MNREQLHTLALGDRSPLEEEHERDPLHLVVTEMDGGVPTLIEDDVARLPVFAELQVALVAVGVLRQVGLFRSVAAIPVWTSFVREAVALRHPDLPDEEAKLHTYIVEATALSRADAHGQAHELALNVVRRMAATLGPGDDDGER